MTITCNINLGTMQLTYAYLSESIEQSLISVSAQLER